MRPGGPGIPASMAFRDGGELQILHPVKPVNPPLKWAGGKRWLLPRLAAIYSEHRHRRLVEPMCGGLAVALGLQPCQALLNDINPHLINFYRWLQRGLELDIALENDEELYYRHRRRFNQLLEGEGRESREAAQLFYYLNRTCFNGLCRFNRQGQFNVPFGRYRRINYRRDFSLLTPTLAGWDFTCGDFVVLDLEARDFVYADPPYDVEFTQYSREGFSWRDQVRLAHWLGRHPGPVVVSNQATERIQQLYRDLGFALSYVQGRRLINSNGDRSPAREILAAKNLDADPGEVGGS